MAETRPQLEAAHPPACRHRHRGPGQRSKRWPYPEPALRRRRDTRFRKDDARASIPTRGSAMRGASFVRNTVGNGGGVEGSRALPWLVARRNAYSRADTV